MFGSKQPADSDKGPSEDAQLKRASRTNHARVGDFGLRSCFKCFRSVQFRDSVRRIESTGVVKPGVRCWERLPVAPATNHESIGSAIEVADEQMAQPMKCRSLLGLAKARLGRVPVAIIARAREGL
jgi:hypothetical protein